MLTQADSIFYSCCRWYSSDRKVWAVLTDVVIICKQSKQNSIHVHIFCFHLYWITLIFPEEINRKKPQLDTVSLSFYCTCEYANQSLYVYSNILSQNWYIFPLSQTHDHINPQTRWNFLHASLRSQWINSITKYKQTQPQPERAFALCVCVFGCV